MNQVGLIPPFAHYDSPIQVKIERYVYLLKTMCSIIACARLDPLFCRFADATIAEFEWLKIELIVAGVLDFSGKLKKEDQNSSSEEA